MDADELVIGQIGLILTQLRRAQRTLEDIERSTARYTGFAFAPLLAGASFGAPPLVGGALAVYVVNINDLAPGGGIGGFFANLLGGVGSFVGSLGGGFLGALIGAAALPYNITQLRRIVDALGPITTTVAGMQKDMPKSPPSAGPSWLDRLPQLTGLVRALTAVLPPLTDLVWALGQNLGKLEDPITKLYRLFTRSSEPATPGVAASPSPPTDWVAVFGELTQVVNGLILLLPLAVGGLVTLIVHLGDIQRILTELLTWAVRMVFLLRGSILVVVYDTLSVAASLGAEVIGLLGTAAGRIMSAVFSAVERGVAGAMDLLQMLGAGLSRTLTVLVNWLVTTLFDVLTGLGNLNIFRLVFRIVDAGNTFMSMLHHIITGGAPPPPPVALSLPPASAGGRLGAGPTSVTGPDLAGALAPPAEVANVGYAYSSAAARTVTEISNAVGAARADLQALGAEQARRERAAPFAQGEIKRSLDDVQAGAKSLGEALQRAQVSAAGRPQAALETVARAYEVWLTGGGMSELLANITTHFRRTPTSGPEAATSILGQVAGGVAEAAASARATVQIDEVIIEVEPPAAPAGVGPQSRLDVEEFGVLLEQYAAERAMRG